MVLSVMFMCLFNMYFFKFWSRSVICRSHVKRKARMGMMQSCHWSNPEESITPPENHPQPVPRATGGGILPTTNQPADLPPEDSPLGKEKSIGDGVKIATQVAERHTSMWEGRYQEQPLQLKRRLRHHRCRRPVVAEDDGEEEEEQTDSGKDKVMIHGLSVQRYREIYHSVLTPAALSALPTKNPPEYMAQVLELKQRLWTVLCRPRLLETVGQDGRVHVTETYDLT